MPHSAPPFLRPLVRWRPPPSRVRTSGREAGRARPEVVYAGGGEASSAPVWIVVGRRMMGRMSSSAWSISGALARGA